MRTYLAKVGEIDRKYVVFDAANQPLGRLAVKITNALRGKDRPTYTPHVDTGAFVIVINAEKVLLTGNKENGKVYSTFISTFPVSSPQYALMVIIDEPQITSKALQRIWRRC